MKRTSKKLEELELKKTMYGNDKIKSFQYGLLL